MHDVNLVLRWVRDVDVPRLAIAIALAIAVLVGLGALHRLTPSPALDPFFLDRPLSPVALLGGGLLLGAAAIALLLRRMSSRGAWSVAAAALGIIALASLTAVDERAQQRLEADVAAIWLPLAAATTIVLVIAAYRLRAQRGPAAVIAAGGVLWLASQLVEAGLGDPSIGESVARSVLAAGAGALLALGLLAFLRGRLAAQPERAAGPPIDSRELTIALALRSSPARIAAWITAVIAVLAVLGAIEGATAIEAHVVNLIGQYTAPAVFSSLLLLAAGWLALIFGPLGERERLGWWRALAGVLLFLVMVEYAAIHHKLEEAIGPGPEQIYLAPVVVLGVAAWAVALRRLAAWRDVAWLWVGGAAAWAIAQAIDLTQPPEQFVWSVVPEEALEMAGSAMFALALLVAIRRVARDAAPPPARPAPRVAGPVG